MAGDKYKIKITNVGVGDPFILFKLEFQDSGDPPDGGGWTLPSASSIYNLRLNINLCNGNCGNELGSYIPAGTIQVDSISKTGPYFFGLPFDQGQFQLGDTLSVNVNISDQNGNLFYIYGDNEYTDHLNWVQTMDYMDQPRNFTNIMVYYSWEDS